VSKHQPLPWHWEHWTCNGVRQPPTLRDAANEVVELSNFTNVAKANRALIARTSQYAAALAEARRIAALAASEMQGRIEDEGHRKAFAALLNISKIGVVS